jgi:hypothetical protein
MKLSTSDTKLFYDLLWALQYFASQRLAIIENVASIEDYLQCSQAEKLKVRDALFNQPELITDFVTENPFNLTSEQLEIVHEWQHFVKDDFYIERYLKTHAIFIGKQVYGVLGLSDSIADIIPKHRLPCLVKTILLPFKNCIVYDGLFESHNIYFGSGIKRSLKERYMKAKQQDSIIVSLGNKAPLLNPDKIQKPKVTEEVNWQKELDVLTHVSHKLKGGSGQNQINSPVFSLLKTSVALANIAIISPHDREALYKSIKKAERALKQIKDTFYRMEEDE